MKTDIFKRSISWLCGEEPKRRIDRERARRKSGSGPLCVFIVHADEILVVDKESGVTVASRKRTPPGRES